MSMPSSRPSGIKPPTRMVKPTSSIPRAGVSSKPAGGDGRQPSDDVTKKKISGFVDDGLSTGKDMVNFKEDSIGELPSLPEIRKNSEIRKLSDGSGSAVDAAYEMARRLSEAGVRRMSDASIILTADTDSFIVGERVYVNGIKPGSIQFIGETKFAPGDWAGIVLDDFSGKNDGSVGGVRYFQCQSKKGVFSRLNRLTREPLDSDQMALLHKKLPVQESPNEKSSENSVNVTSRHFTPPPTESTPASGSPSLVSVQSIGDLHLGDRVIVTSTQGSKTGTLRYLGNTEFAAGQWAGVELDDSLGKNDGAVAGTRYFDCQPMYGLFAPVHKVSRSPANAMSRRSSSMMNASMSSISRHGGLVRQGTRDSMGSSASIISTVSRASTAGVRPSANPRLGINSLTSSPTNRQKSTRPSASGHSQIGLQDLLREKEQHIEQLLKEREMERCEVTRAAAQADEAEHQLALLQRKYQTDLESAESERQRIEALLMTAEASRSTMAAQVDDLQFQIEESQILLSEMETQHKSLEDKEKDVLRQLEEERARVEQLEKEAQRSFEAEEVAARYKDELDSLTEQLNQSKQHIAYLESCTARSELNSRDSLCALQIRIKELESFIEVKEGDILKLKEQVTFIEDEFELSRSTASSNEDNLRTRVQQLESNVKIKDNEFETLQKTNLQLEMIVTNMSAETSEGPLKARIAELEAADNARQVDCQKMDETIQRLENVIAANSMTSVATENKLRETIKLLQSDDEIKLREIEELKEIIRKMEVGMAAISSAASSTESELREKIELVETDSRANTRENQELKEIIQKLENDIAANSLDTAATENALLEKIKLLEEGSEGKRREHQEYQETIKHLNNLMAANHLIATSIQEELNDKIKLLEVSNETAMNENENLKRELRVTSEAANNLRRQLQSTKENADSLVIDVKHIKEDLQKSEDRGRCLEQVRNETETRLHHMAAETSALKRQIDLNECQIQQLKEEKLKIESELLQLSRNGSEDLTRLHTELMTARNLITELQSNIATLEQDKAHLDYRLTESEKSNISLTMEVSSGQNSIALLTSAKDEIENELSTLTKRQTDLMNTIHQCEHANKTSAKTIVKLERDITISETALDRSNLEKTCLEKELSSLLTREAELKQEIELLEKKNDSLHSQVTQLTKESRDFLTKIETTEANEKKLEQEIAQLLGKMNDLKASVSKFKHDTMVKEETIASLQLNEEQLRRESESLHTTIVTLESKVKKAEVEMLQMLNDKDLMELKENKSMEDFNILCLKVSALEADKDQLLVEKKSLKELTGGLNDQIHQLKTSAEQRDRDLENREAKLLILTIEMEQLRNEFSSHSDQLKLQQAQTEQERLRADEARDALKESHFQCQQVLDQCNQLRLDNKEKEEVMAGTNNSLKRKLEEEKQKAALVASGLQEELQQLRVKILEGEKILNENMKNLDVAENQVNELKQVLGERDKAMQKLYIEITDLQDKAGDSSRLLNAYTALDKEKRSLEERIVELQVAAVRYSTDTQINVDVTAQKLKEENEMLQREIKFLNSVIVDMQKKVDNMKMELEVSQASLLGQNIGGKNHNGIKTNAVAPRLFCDICDLFDLHDTEDCPKQASDDVIETPSMMLYIDSPSSNEHSRHGGRREQSRPYCEVCEIFGHATGDCDEDATF